jgi:hypothetical protein
MNASTLSDLIRQYREKTRPMIRSDLDDVKKAFESELEFYNQRLIEVESKLEKIDEAEARLKALMIEAKLPTKYRLEQFKNGIKLLTQFANELQRDIDNSKV